MPRTTADWQAMRAQARPVHVEAGDGWVYLCADSHLGDAAAPPEELLHVLQGLEDARALVLLGDLFKVWLAPPKYWDAQARAFLEGLEALRARGTRVLLVVGNREFFLPHSAAAAARYGLPFDSIVHDAAVLHWGGRRYLLTHGDVANRRDTGYLRWRRLARGRLLEAAFKALPGPLARGVAHRVERAMAASNQPFKIGYPTDELQAFTRAMLLDVDAAFIGHFHRDETLTVPDHPGWLRIVPDWLGKRTLLRLGPDGTVETLRFGEPPSPE